MSSLDADFLRGHPSILLGRCGTVDERISALSFS
jgi:hypothetical protein